jgi:hypothetical protein
MNYATANAAAGPRPNALKIAAIGAEIAVVSTLAVSSYHIAFSGPSPDWLASAPILTVVALESMRLPLAFRLSRMRLLGLACSVAMLGGLSVITGEAASVAYENLIFQRTRPVVEAERDLAKAEISRTALKAAADRRAEEISRLTTDIESARAHRADIDKPPRLAWRRSRPGRTCAGRRGSWNCGAAVQTEAVRANAAAQAAETRLATAAPGPDMRASDSGRIPLPDGVFLTRDGLS